MILVLITITLLAWTFIHYQYQESVQHRLKQLSDIPVYVYSDNPETLESLTKDLRNGIPEIDSLITESGVDAARQVLRDYPLGIVPSTLEDYVFPSSLTISFKPNLASLTARTKALEIIKRYQIAPQEIENQEAAWTLLKTDLDYLRDRWSNSTIFTALIVFLLFLFARLYLILADPKAKKGITATILDALQQKEHKKTHSLMLLAVPFLVNVVAYQLALAAKLAQPLVDWVFFLVQFGVVVTATIVVAMLDSMTDTAEDNTHSFTLDIPKKS